MSDPVPSGDYCYWLGFGVRVGRGVTGPPTGVIDGDGDGDGDAVGLGVGVSMQSIWPGPCACTDCVPFGVRVGRGVTGPGVIDGDGDGDGDGLGVQVMPGSVLSLSSRFTPLGRKLAAPATITAPNSAISSTVAMAPIENGAFMTLPPPRLNAAS